MDRQVIRHIFGMAEDKDYLKIDYGTKSMTIPKRFLDYKILCKGHYLEIANSSKRETYLIKTDSIDLITIIEPKLRPLKV